MDTQTNIRKEQLQLIGVTCLFISSKIEVLFFILSLPPSIALSLSFTPFSFPLLSSLFPFIPLSLLSFPSFSLFLILSLFPFSLLSLPLSSSLSPFLQEIYPPKLADFAYVTDGACNSEEIVFMELLICKVSRQTCCHAHAHTHTHKLIYTQATVTVGVPPISKGILVM